MGNQLCCGKEKEQIPGGSDKQLEMNKQRKK